LHIIADTHTHTIACDHAFSTIAENAATAKERGIRFLCMTEHCPAMAGAPSRLYFEGLLGLVPPVINGVTIRPRAELNIISSDGELDLSESYLGKMDWVIASMHVVTYKPSEKTNHTRAWLAIAENPLVDVIGHCGDGRYPFDEDVVLPAFKKHGKIVEINNNSFGVREGSAESCERIARKCAALGIPIVVSSDAHFHEAVGLFPKSISMLASIGFPEELILNADYDRFLAVVKEKAGPKMKTFLSSL
jgi:putative hydrolase